MERLIITIDGPAGSGKSTVAQLLAKRMGLRFLDTGAMYRGLAVCCLDNRIDPRVEPLRVAELARSTRILFDWDRDPPQLRVDDRDVSGRIRDPDVTEIVSDVASIPAVRQVMVDQQRRIGEESSGLVTEGRDQGSVVFPEAQAKFYLDASLSVRAQRRTDQFRGAGQEAQRQEVQDAIQNRDERDRGRSEGPLNQPKDAIRIDTSQLSLDQVVDLLEAKVRSRLTQSPLAVNQRRSSSAYAASGGEPSP